MKKKNEIKLTKDQLCIVFGAIPDNKGNTEKWCENWLKEREVKWNKLEPICDKYNLGTGDIFRDREKGQMTNEYYDRQDTTLKDIERTNEFKSRGYDTIWMSDARDYFEYINNEWVWKIDGKENYNKLLIVNSKSIKN